MPDSTSPRSFGQRLSGFFGKKGATPISVVPESTPAPNPPKPPQAASAERIPGNYFGFGFLMAAKINGADATGYPAKCFRTPAGESWQTVLGDGPRSSQYALWVDHPERGLNLRTIESAEDPLGAEGTFGGRPYRIERVLNITRNMVVYAFYSPLDHTRTAYGFPRTQIERGYVPPPREQQPT